MAGTYCRDTGKHDALADGDFDLGGRGMVHSEILAAEVSHWAAVSARAIGRREDSGTQRNGWARDSVGRRNMRRNLYIGAAFFAFLIALGVGSTVLEKRAAVEAAGVQAPRFEVDPMWPKPLPNHWLLGMTIGVSLDAQDHVWIIHRGGSLERMENYAAANPPASACCMAAPPVLEFDEEGNLLRHWAGPGQGYDWPASNHGITIDYKGNVWIGGNGRGAAVAPPTPAAAP